MSYVEEARLRQCLAKYKNPEITKKDIINVLTQYKGLIFKQETYVFNDGTPRELVNLSGTIPVTYKGSIYNIPVCIWLMDTHPYNAPLCYVKPTSDMNIKVSMFVDQNGKIYLPYLHDWIPNSSDLEGLVQVMIVMFGEQPPVYAKPREASVPYPTQPLYMPQPGVMPPYYAAGAYPPYAGPSQFGAYPAPGQGPGGAPAVAASQSGTITDEHIRASLMSAVEDKLRRRLRERAAQHQAELETLRRTQQELGSGRERLAQLLARLAAERADLEQSATILRDKEHELDTCIARLAQQQAIDVDSAVTTTAPLYRQLLACYGEEAATEDAIYYVGEALRQGVVDLDVFLKQVRALSRKQFMLRATMHACRKKAGLAG